MTRTKVVPANEREIPWRWMMPTRMTSSIPSGIATMSLDNLDVSPCDFQVFKFLEFAEPPRILI